MERHSSVLRSFLLLILLAQCGPEEAESMPYGKNTQNPIPNPSFEEAEGKGPAGWKPVSWLGAPQFKYVAKGRKGRMCICIESEKGADAAFQAEVPVKSYSRYRLTGWIKTEDLAAGSGKGALLNLDNLQPLQTEAVTGTTDWTKVELVFDTEAHDVLQINCLFGGWGVSKGKAWFDDVNLELISSRN
jgi:hypothetical protein